MGIAQIIIIVFFLIRLIIIGLQHGYVKDRPVNFWSALMKTIFILLVLYFGSFFG